VIGFMLDALREWKRTYMSRAVFLASLLVAFAGVVGMLHPLFIMISVSVVSLFLGWSCGSSYRIASSSRRQLIYCQVRAGSAIMGKTLSALVIWFFVMAVLSPPIYISACVHGLFPEVLALCFTASLVTFYFAFSVSLFVGFVFPRSDGVVSFLLLVSWVGVSFSIQPLRHSNPFIQIFNFMKKGEDTYEGLWICAAALVSVLLVYGSIAALARIRKHMHE